VSFNAFFNLNVFFFGLTEKAGEGTVDQIASPPEQSIEMSMMNQIRCLFNLSMIRCSNLINNSLLC